MSKPSVLALTGPTAVGKTALCEGLAASHDISIVSIDSRQIYKEIDIGSAKPSKSELERTKHYLIDELRLEEKVSAGIYREKVLRATREILDQNRLPVWVGGSTLYFHALLHGIADIPEVSPSVRAETSEKYYADPESAFQLLSQVDPKIASNLDPSKSHRIIRALEVFKSTGKPLSQFHAEMEAPDYSFNIRLVVLQRDRNELYQRINSRVDAMLADGLIDEVKAIIASSPNYKELLGLNSIGYKEVLQFIDGEIEKEEMTELIKRNSRRYAKRQITWFKKYADISATLNLSDCTSDEAISRLINHL